MNCDDGLFCTLDFCQEPTGTCVSTPADVFCSDGKLCNGVEVCDPAKGDPVTACTAGAPHVCPSDGIGCIEEVCDATVDACVTKENNALCPCGQTCSGAKGGCGNFCEVKTCSNGKVYACGDCLDNDGDCKIDGNDSQCLGACDNTENAGPVQGSGCYFAAAGAVQPGAEVLLDRPEGRPAVHRRQGRHDDAGGGRPVAD